LAELECAFGENPATSDGERYAASPNAEGELTEGASDNAKLQMCHIRSLTMTVVKLRRWKRKVTFQRTRLAHLGLKTYQSQMAMKPQYKSDEDINTSATIR
jgi:hypothetical protein